jgi:hypothetical protein
MSRGTQSSDASRKRRLDRISRIKSEIRRLESKTGKDKGGRNTTRISQLKKRLREIGGGGAAPKTYNTKKVKVKTSRGLRIRNVSTEKPKTKKNGKLSNIPAGEESVNNPNLGKPGDLSAFKKDKQNKDTSQTVNKTVNKTENKTNGASNNTPESKLEKKSDKLKIKKSSARNFIKTKKGFARRGTPMAKRAEEREKARKRLAAKGYMKNR